MTQLSDSPPLGLLSRGYLCVNVCVRMCVYGIGCGGAPPHVVPHKGYDIHIHAHVMHWRKCAWHLKVLPPPRLCLNHRHKDTGRLTDTDIDTDTDTDTYCVFYYHYFISFFSPFFRCPFYRKLTHPHLLLDTSIFLYVVRCVLWMDHDQRANMNRLS